MDAAHRYQRIVVKLGTSVLTGGTTGLDRAHMVEIVRQCAALHLRGHSVIICTSGAIAAGRERLGHPDLPDTITIKQMLAAVGQSRLIHTWEQLFDIYGIRVGQVLLTRSDVEDRHRFLNARDTLQALLEHRIVPIINENDAVATAEIKVGDNDNLSALVALLVEANLLMLLTDQAGLFTADPRVNPDAGLIAEVEDITKIVESFASGSQSGLGIGGMVTKLEAANIARRAGADVVIAAGRTEDVIERIARGEATGTRFPATATPIENRKRWILAGKATVGTVSIDSGAERALSRNGSSLLPAGILKVTGTFDRGDVVAILNEKGERLARGIARYGSQDLDRIKGGHSEKIAETLGFTYGPVAIHRNDLVLT